MAEGEKHGTERGHPGTARMLPERVEVQTCCVGEFKENSSSTRPRLSLSQTMILHQRRMAGALSCTGHAVTCSGARPVDHKKSTNEVELKQYNELVLAADTLSASAVEAVYMLPHVALTYAFTKKFKRAFASRQNQSLQKDQEDQTLLARSVHTYLLRYFRAGLRSSWCHCLSSTSRTLSHPFVVSLI